MHSYHITEVPMFISGQFLCISDPQKRYLSPNPLMPSLKTDGLKIAFPGTIYSQYTDIMSLFGAFEDSGTIVCFEIT